jgi:hypothetical protein
MSRVKFQAEDIRGAGSDAVRSKIKLVELTLKETDMDTKAAINAIVDVLREIARAQDAIERQSAAVKAGR